MTGAPFDRVLVANRGEIACRVLRTCRRLGITTVAIASDADREEPHARMADELVVIGAAPPALSYLDAQHIVEVALDRGVDAVHPGYGFLAESPDFAQAVDDAGLTFVGPSARVIRLMGDKAAAKRHLAAAGVPLLPGTHDRDLDDAGLLAAARELDVPLLVKPVAGGGGKGMRVVEDLAALPAALASARREAQSAFGDARLMLERLVTRSRHVEVQVMADAHGCVLHLFERECSIQRRHQKIVEECPSPAVDEALRARMTEAAVAATRAVDYLGAGTIEFLLDADTLAGDRSGHTRPDVGTFAFLEMNTRLQVEHPVTEAVTGLDLVELQLRVAAGEPLAVTQQDITRRGHAIEVRVYAEDPVTSLPQTGTVLRFSTPDRHWLRVDAGIARGSRVTPHYDPLLAKLVVHAPDRRRAIERLVTAVAGTTVHGVTTNLELLTAIAGSDAFGSGVVTTDFLRDHLGTWAPAAADDDVLRAAVLAVADTWNTTTAPDPFTRLGPFRSGGVGGTPLTLVEGDVAHRLTVTATAPGQRIVRRAGRELEPPNDAPETLTTTVEDGGAAVWVHWSGGTRRFTVRPPTRHRDLATAAGETTFTAPMPGSVLEVGVVAGQHVTPGCTLAVVEAMKMEHPVTAPTTGTVTRVHVAEGDRVEAGSPIVSFSTHDPLGAEAAH